MALRAVTDESKDGRLEDDDDLGSSPNAVEREKPWRSPEGCSEKEG